jgi:hypothetical protein
MLVELTEIISIYIIQVKGKEEGSPQIFPACLPVGRDKKRRGLSQTETDY